MATKTPKIEINRVSFADPDKWAVLIDKKPAGIIIYKNGSLTVFDEQNVVIRFEKEVKDVPSETKLKSLSKLLKH